MADNPIEKGVSTLKKLPPLALVAIVVIGVGGVLYIRSRKPPSDTSAPASGDTELDQFEPVKIGAVERGPVGALPPSIMPGASPDQAVVPPRRDTSAPDASPSIPATPAIPVGDTNRGAIDPYQHIRLPSTEPTQQATPVAPVQTYTPITEVKQYPGYPNNFEPTRAMVQDTSGLLSWDQLVANEKSKGPGWNNTAQQRNLAQIAIGGTARKGVQTKGSAYPGVSATNTNRIWTNNVRVSAGLRPLTGKEWDQAQAFMSQLWNGDENAQVFQSGAYAKAVFERYNLPYRYV